MVIDALQSSNHCRCLHRLPILTALGVLRLCPARDRTRPGACRCRSSCRLLEARVVGCLIEKQIATPDQYPLSLNALVNACNQKSNRDPVIEPRGTRGRSPSSTALIRKQLVLEKSGLRQPGAEVPPAVLQHAVRQPEVLAAQTAIVCELLLRGPQTPGELRTHAGRLATVHGLDEVENALADLDDAP
ncbi:MAG: YceH family protein [Ignavibacteriales bacterium]|nr:YceH family protein [Ignavibacteriales bacterium]